MNSVNFSPAHPAAHNLNPANLPFALAIAIISGAQSVNAPKRPNVLETVGMSAEENDVSPAESPRGSTS